MLNVQVSEGSVYDSIIQFLAVHMNELTADLSCLTSLLKKGDLDPQGSQSLLQSTTRSVIYYALE